MDSFWTNHRAEVLAAEAALLEAGGDLARVTRVGHLKGLIVSRTGKVPKAKSNANDAMRIEAAAAVELQPATLMPVTSAAESAPASDEVMLTCESCGELTPSSAVDCDGRVWCECGERLDSDSED
mmetsp:Transcript_24399/g.62951  ORF Transcript_24399/g.62951 Transcript_24399/m.62951 type:complete len:125 (-) Transcript_24399:663-1037(-)